MKAYLILIFQSVIVFTSQGRQRKLYGDEKKIRKCEIHFKSDDGKDLILNYELESHSAAQKFARLIRKIQNKSRYEMKYTSWGVYPAGDEALRKLHKDLQSSIDYFDSRNGAGLKVQYALPPVEKVTPRDLNMIHAEFERLITRTFAVPTGEHNKNGQLVSLRGSANDIKALERSLNNINGLVHSMEHVIARPPKCYDSFFTSYMSSDPYVDNIPLSPEEYKLFTLDMQFGDLFLGYGTTGKSLYHIFKDKDLALVKAGGRPSPQVLHKYVDTETFAVHSDIAYLTRLFVCLFVCLFLSVRLCVMVL